MQVDIGGKQVDLAQLELNDDDIVVDVLVLCRLQRMHGDHFDEGMAWAISDGTTAIVLRGMLEGARDSTMRGRSASAD